MYKIAATFEVVTPMFLGGADNKTTAELRPTSIKGQLRFWWRALAWGRIGNLEAIRTAEARIFGSADENFGWSSFSLKSHWVSPPWIFYPPLPRNDESSLDRNGQSERKQIKNEHRLTLDGTIDGAVVGDGARYLGYGLLEAFGRVRRKDPRDRNSPVIDVFVPGEISRPCIFHFAADAAPARFCVRLVSRDPFKAEFLDALKIFGLLGGLGARVRRGWGSVALVELHGDGVDPEWSPPANADEYGERIKHIVGIGASCVSPPEYSAFFDKTRMTCLLQAPNALDALNDVGEKFLQFRSGKTGAPERNFPADHDGFRIYRGNWNVAAGDFESGYPAIAVKYPLRVALGLPHNYSKQLQIEAECQKRRASPLLFHIHPIGNEYTAVATVFPTRFLPDVEDSTTEAMRPEKIKIINGAGPPLVENHVDYRIIDAFLDGYTTSPSNPTAPSTARSYFPVRRAILP